MSPRGPLSISTRNSSIPTTRQSRATVAEQLKQLTEPQLRLRNPNPRPTFKRFSTNNLNNTMTSGSVRYLHINSRHLPRQQNQELFTINLLEPIRNASHLELTAFSVANDFSNVLPDNNKFRILFKRAPDTGTTALNDVFMIEVELETGFYTHAELIAEILAQITLTSNGYYNSATQTVDADGFYTVYPKLLAVGASTFVTQTTYGVLFKPTVESNGKPLLNLKL